MFAYHTSLSCISHFIDICTVVIKNIRIMQAASTNQIADISHFNDSIKGHVKGEDEIWSVIERSGLDKC